MEEMKTLAVRNTKVVRISSDLDDFLRDFSIKNDMKYIDASKEVAKLNSKIKFNKSKLFKELRF